MKILFGVFDWGLGHATRDTPLFETLLRQGHDVDIISTGRALMLLRERFGDACTYYDVPSIVPRAYAAKSFALGFVLTSPAAINDLRIARKGSAPIIKKGSYDLIVSDSRYDVYDKPENSYLITHQLRFKNRFFDAVPAGIPDRVYSYGMRKYGAVIVPDFPQRTLSGELSSNPFYKGSVHNIGIISQLRKLRMQQDIDYFISLSGPEPQRTILQNLIQDQLGELDGTIVIAGGTPDAQQLKKHKNVTHYGFLNQAQQERIMNRASCVISRSGYSTVMDLVELGKRRVLYIPTPSTVEQEYLADFYERKRYFHHVEQDNLSLGRDVAAIRGVHGYTPPWKTAESARRFLRAIKC